MMSGAPYLYSPVKSGNFDPKAISRASFAPRPVRPKQDGPLVNFNQHPDSYLILPNQTKTQPMNPNVKTWVKWMRIVQLVLRCFEVLCAIALLVILIMLRGMDPATGWIMRIAPGVAILHTIYAIYHLARKPSARTPGTSASYMLFASFLDVSIIPFYAFSALVADTKQDTWSIILDDQALTPTFSKLVFYLATVGGGLHLISLADGLYLAVTFRRIAKMPPDMNVLEPSLTSRYHKRNKSSMSSGTTLNEKRLSEPLESKRSSGAPYEDLSRPPSIPFFNTRTQSTTSFSTYKSTPPPSRDSRAELPSRQYQIPAAHSPRTSVTDLKRQSYGSQSPSKRGSYSEIPLHDTGSPWFTSDSITQKARPKSSVPGKGTYAPIPHSDSVELPHPLEANPPSPPKRHKTPFHSRDLTGPLSEISSNRMSGDITELRGTRYGELSAGPSPIMGGRQVSSGNDYNGKRRDVSGKVAEEGRAWSARFRKISGRH